MAGFFSSSRRANAGYGAEGSRQKLNPSRSDLDWVHLQSTAHTSSSSTPSSPASNPHNHRATHRALPLPSNSPPRSGPAISAYLPFPASARCIPHLPAPTHKHIAPLPPAVPSTILPASPTVPPVPPDKSAPTSPRSRRSVSLPSTVPDLLAPRSVHAHSSSAG